MIHPVEKSMKEKFGTTPSFKFIKSAWLLSDGSLVGRPDDRSLRADKFKAHFQMIADSTDESPPLDASGRCGSRCMTKFMSMTGAMRIATTMQETQPIFDVVATKKTLTSEQMKTLHDACSKFRGGCIIYMTDKRGRDCGRYEGGVGAFIEGLERCRA